MTVRRVIGSEIMTAVNGCISYEGTLYKYVESRAALVAGRSLCYAEITARAPVNTSRASHTGMLKSKT